MAGVRRVRTPYPLPYVYVNKGRVEYRPRVSFEDREQGVPVDKGGFLKPPIKLGVEGDSLEDITKAWLAAKSAIRRETVYKTCTLYWILDKYQHSRKYAELAPSSQKRNKNLIKILEHKLEINGKLACLGDLHIKAINKPLFRALAERRLNDYRAAGNKGEVQVNREITLISSALSWAVSNLPELAELGIHENPLLKIEKIKEHQNERYITDQEYEIQYQIAAEVSDYLQPVMELTYLTASRGIETLDLKLSDCSDIGIKTTRRKGSRDNIILWSPRLLAAKESALALHKSRKIRQLDPHLIPGFSGGALAKSTLDAAFQRLKQLMESRGLANTYFSLHLLKAKGVSDSDDKGIAGHVTEAMRQRYDVKVHEHKPAR